MQELARNQARLAFLLHESPAVIYTAKAEPGGVTDYISPNVAELLGHAPEIFAEQPSFWIDNIHPEDLERMPDQALRSVRHRAFAG